MLFWFWIALAMIVGACLGFLLAAFCYAANDGVEGPDR